jgi:hypothetical protein
MEEQLSAYFFGYSWQYYKRLKCCLFTTKSRESEENQSEESKKSQNSEHTSEETTNGIKSARLHQS